MNYLVAKRGNEHDPPVKAPLNLAGYSLEVCLMANVIAIGEYVELSVQ